MITRLSLLLSCILFFISPAVSAVQVTFVNPGKQGERFWDMVTETMQAAATDFDISLEVLYAERNRVRMTELGIAATQRATPPDYLILVNEEQAAERILQSASEQNIKVLMLLNDFLPEQRQRVGTPDTNASLLGAIIPDNFSAGQRMMQALLGCAREKHPQGPYHILAIGGDQTTPASLARNQGAMDIVTQNTDIQLDRFLFANWNQQEANRLSNNYLNWARRNQITPTAIWSANDPIAMGARDALLSHQIKPGEEVCQVGLNWSAQGLDMVRNGQMILTDGGHFLAGAWAMVLLNDYHTSSMGNLNQPPGTINFQMQSIDKSNIEHYLDHLGDENWDQIDFTGFSSAASDSLYEYDFSLENVFSQVQK